jgi:hypothetical protein
VRYPAYTEGQAPPMGTDPSPKGQHPTCGDRSSRLWGQTPRRRDSPLHLRGTDPSACVVPHPLPVNCYLLLKKGQAPPPAGTDPYRACGDSPLPGTGPCRGTTPFTGDRPLPTETAPYRGTGPYLRGQPLARDSPLPGDRPLRLDSAGVKACSPPGGILNG